ncbi:MAG: hypothetical protein ACREJ0_00545, partial [Geminicoccaceae bacterium]
MQHSAQRFPWYALAASLATLSVACSSDPARLVQLSGEPARQLAAYQPAQPVLVARADGRAVAIVFSENEGDIPRILDTVLVDEVEGCEREGAVACCDPDTKTFFINSEEAWVRMGEQ